MPNTTRTALPAGPDIQCASCLTLHPLTVERINAHVQADEVGLCFHGTAGWECDCGAVMSDRDVQRVIEEMRDVY